MESSWSLQLDDPSLEADGRRVRPIIGTEFRKDAFHSALDGVLRDAELIGDLLVRVPGRDESQHDHFGRCRRLSLTC